MENNKDKTNLTERSPVIAIMGHIDHGKSTLLDYIRKTNVAEGETGGITQRISAYEITHKDKSGKDKKITFLDTPGHEAFQKMRFCGAEAADIAVLVVSAEDGVKTQTLEALKCVKESKIPYIIAINKIDKQTANVEKVKQDLLENEIYLEGLGGEVPFVPISAKTGQGIDELLDIMLLVAEVEELKGDTSINAEGIVIESHLDAKKGVSATLIIKTGTLKTGMFVVVGESLSPVRIIEDFLGKNLKEVTFSSPAQIIGFDEMPRVGILFQSFNTKKEAENLIANASKQKEMVQEKSYITYKNNKEIIEILIIINADVSGTLEAIDHELAKLENDSVQIKVVQKSVGDISESDIKVASSKKGTFVLGFNVKTDSRAESMAERLKVEIKIFDIIYKLSEWLSGVIEKRLAEIETEKIVGKAKILKLFGKVKDKQVVGGSVIEGSLSVKEEVRIKRKDIEIGSGKILNLQKAKSDAKQISEGDEFGAQIQSQIEIMSGDIIERSIISKS